MQTITTTYYGPTDKKPSQIKAKTTGGISKRFSASQFTHESAAKALAQQMGWKGTMVGGALNNWTEVWVFIGKPSPRIKL